jgi:hypothetical protein
VALIEVVPDEVRYWLATGSSPSRGIQEVGATVQGTVAMSGELRTITKQEVSNITRPPRSHVFAHIGPQIELIQGRE